MCTSINFGIRRLFIGAFITLLLLQSIGEPTHAQPPPPPQPQNEAIITANPNALHGVAMFMAQSGTLVENTVTGTDATQTYTLTLTDTPDAGAYWLQQPGFMPLPPELIGDSPVDDTVMTGNLLVSPMVNAWRSLGVPMRADAWLTTSSATAHLTVYRPDYFPDTKTLTFQAEIISVVGGEANKGLPILPESFRRATLALTLDPVLLMGLDMGIANALQGIVWACQGNQRQLAICECKRNADSANPTNREARVEAYAACNLLRSSPDEQKR